MKNKFEDQETDERADETGGEVMQSVENSVSDQGNTYLSSPNSLIWAVERMFSCSKGEPKATGTAGGKQYPYETMKFGMRTGNTQEASEELSSVALKTFEALQEDGATKLVWRTQPTLHQDFDEGIIVLRARFFCVNDAGEQVLLQARHDGVESRTPIMIGEPEPEVPTGDGIEVEETEVTATFSYDLITAKDEAILHCGLLIHEAVKALNDAHNEYTIPWEANKASVCAGIERLLGKDGNESFEDNHNAWMAYKYAEGWVYGETKSAEAKTHPCLVPFLSLPPIQQAKDMIFSGIVRAYFGLPSA